MVWFVILLQAVGGLVVAVVVKYADNILKGLAAAFSIITACIICYFFLDFKPTVLFVVGAFLVNFSIYLYDRGLPPFLAAFLRRKPGPQDQVNAGPENSLRNLGSSLVTPLLAKDPSAQV